MKFPKTLNPLFVIGLSILAGCVQSRPQSAVATGQPISQVQTSAVNVCNIRYRQFIPLAIVRLVTSLPLAQKPAPLGTRHCVPRS